MRRILLSIALSILCGTFAYADKVIESSARRQPSWIGGMQEGYFIASAQAGTLEEAQQKAITSVREQIIAAVATKVHSATSITLHEVTDNGSIKSHKEMNSILTVEAADIPYLANISPSHAEAYYWAKIRRKDKSTYYHYHVKYPLSNSKLRLLVDEYEKSQKAIRDTLQSFASLDFSAYDNLSDILQAYNRLRQFDETLNAEAYHNLCSAIRQSYDRMLTGNLHADVINSTREEAQARLMYGTKPLAHNLRPKVKSNCLTAIEVKAQEASDVITYDYQTGCYDEDLNWLDITYTVNGKKITTRCYIK